MPLLPHELRNFVGIAADGSAVGVLEQKNQLRCFAYLFHQARVVQTAAATGYLPPKFRVELPGHRSSLGRPFRILLFLTSNQMTHLRSSSLIFFFFPSISSSIKFTGFTMDDMFNLNSTRFSVPYVNLPTPGRDLGRDETTHTPHGYLLPSPAFFVIPPRV